MRAVSPFAVLLLVSVLAPASARAEGAEVVVGVPVRNGTAGEPRPGVIVDVAPKQQAPLPAPILVHEGDPHGGTTTVRPEFGGGYSVESPGRKTTVRPHFGGGYSVQENGKTTTTVTPNFGGGYRVESTQDAPVLVVPPPDR